MPSVPDSALSTKSYNSVSCNLGVSSGDRTNQAILWSVLMGAAATYNTGQAINFANKQYSMAKDYLKISQWWNDYKRTYFDPVEDQELDEAMKLTEETPYYDVAKGRAQTAGRIRFKNAVNKAVQCTSEYCTGLRGVLLRDTLAQEAMTVAALSNFGYRHERAYIESRSDVRWKRMLATASRGRGMQATAVSQSQLAFGIYGSLGEAAGKGAAGAASLGGYFWNRNDTIYPTLLRSTDNGSGAPMPVQTNSNTTAPTGQSNSTSMYDVVTGKAL